MDEEQFNIACVFPNIAVQIRNSLGTLHLAAAQLAPALERERDPELDAKAALLDQSYYQLLRLVNNLNVAGSLGQEGPLPVRDRDMVEAIQMICDATQSLADLRNIRLEFRFTSVRSTISPSSSWSISCSPTPSNSRLPGAPSRWS